MASKRGTSAEIPWMVIAGEQATREGVGATLRESKQAGGGHHAGAEIISLSLCSALLKAINRSLLLNSAATLCCCPELCCKSGVGAKDQEWAKDSLPLLCKNL